MMVQAPACTALVINAQRRIVYSVLETKWENVLETKWEPLLSNCKPFFVCHILRSSIVFFWQARLAGAL